MHNYRLTVCYDGTRYNGWQKQGNTENTIQAKLEAVLGRVIGESIEINACGRTDAGVHAAMQVCSFLTEEALDCDITLTELRKFLPEDIGAVSLESAPPRFHARLSCREKTYVYSIWNSSAPNVFQRKYSYTFPEKLDTEEMKKAAEYLIGSHDFAPFSSVKHSRKSTVRELKRLEITREGDMLRLYLTGDGFLYNMVRIIVGTLLEVGTGRRSADSIAECFSGTRLDTGFTAPAKGLTLWKVKY